MRAVINIDSVPESCKKCRFYNHSNGNCIVLRRNVACEKIIFNRHDNCPITELYESDYQLMQTMQDMRHDIRRFMQKWGK
ncbi:MAG: hypothetical protein RSD65_06260 [Anaerovoracaceae bacterium]